MTSLIACLDMYCWPENRPAWEAFWDNVGEQVRLDGIEAPEALTFGGDPWAIWKSPELLLGHTCGWPYVSQLRNKVALVGCFDFHLSGCPAGYYQSVYIGRSGMAGTEVSRELITEDEISIAVNGLESQSGFRVLREIVGGDPLEVVSPGQVVQSGSHRNSIRAVADGDADIAAIDGVTWELAKIHEPAAQEVVVLGHSTPVPGLPLITAATFNAYREKLAKAVHSALQSSPDLISTSLAAPEFVDMPDVAYDVLK